MQRECSGMTVGEERPTIKDGSGSAGMTRAFDESELRTATTLHSLSPFFTGRGLG
ncbi:hypothetical protein SSBR45G_30880 [Bradyrhizobium sp. SSBR45G]|nr:hypothetical protein SSBR45G_30880 [Bradyrhizobium sp. SSBR45G]GLH86054.1 hypothetical protein SSBR45R_35140 [Bradyrhizobium sp. SSBR45R]